MKRFIPLLFIGAALAQPPEECPEGATCGVTVFYSSGGGGPVEPPVEPPVDPPPVEPPIEPPPPDPGARARWVQQCERADTLACWTADGPEDVYRASWLVEAGEGSGVPNSPNSPMTNGKCHWVNPPGQQECFPAFGSDAAEAAKGGVRAEPEEWTCEHRRALRETAGYSQETSLRASLLSPCYHPEVGAMVLSDWNNLGSSINHAGVANWNADRPTVEVLEVEYEIYIDDSMARQRKGSNTAKLMRIHQVKQPYCHDDRFADERFLEVVPEGVTLGYVAYCTPGGYVPPEANYRVAKGDPRWLRVWRRFDSRADEIRSRVTDVASGEVLYEYTQTEDRHGNPLSLPGPWTLKSARWLNHSSSHERCVEGVDCDVYTAGHYAVRHVRYAGD